MEAVEAARVEQPDEPAEDADQREPGQVRRRREIGRAVRSEQRAVALDPAEDRVADAGGDEARQQRGGVEVVAVEDLRRQHGAAQRGAEIAPIPAPMPAATATRESSGGSSRTRASSEPKPALIWPVGPSRPPEPPEPIVSAEATILTRTVRKRTPRGLWWTAAIAASVPWPSASGAIRKTRIAPSSAPPLAIRGSAQGRAGPAPGATFPSPNGSGTCTRRGSPGRGGWRPAAPRRRRPRRARRSRRSRRRARSSGGRRTRRRPSGRRRPRASAGGRSGRAAGVTSVARSRRSTDSRSRRLVPAHKVPASARFCQIYDNARIGRS